MSLDVIADVDAANGLAQAWTYHVKMLFQTDCLGRNRVRRRIAVLDEQPRILFPKPIPSVYLRVRFCKPLIPEVQSAAVFLRRLRAVHDARRNIEPVSEFMDEDGFIGRSAFCVGIWIPRSVRHSFGRSKHTRRFDESAFGLKDWQPRTSQDGTLG